MRGEQHHRGAVADPPLGSPPRARGAGPAYGRRWLASGITPACAGSRPTSACGESRSRDHPRVRGEQVAWPRCAGVGRGSPPRARGADRRARKRRGRRRITPACAGSRDACGSRRTPDGDHPRVRGEQAGRAGLPAWLSGSPPRARGAERRVVAGARLVGITPACAGSRRGCSAILGSRRDHPRVRGEQSSPHRSDSCTKGSPPRARGADLLTCGARDQLRRFSSLCFARSPSSSAVGRASGVWVRRKFGVQSSGCHREDHRRANEASWLSWAVPSARNVLPDTMELP